MRTRLMEFLPVSVLAVTLAVVSLLAHQRDLRTTEVRAAWEAGHTAGLEEARKEKGSSESCAAWFFKSNMKEVKAKICHK